LLCGLGVRVRFFLLVARFGTCKSSMLLYLL
jgi:hypothetical protein